MGAAPSASQAAADAAVKRAIETHQAACASPPRRLRQRSSYAPDSGSQLSIAGLAQSFRLSLPAKVPQAASPSRVGLAPPSSVFGASVLVDGEEEPQSVPKLRVPPLNFNRVPRKGSLRLSRGSRRSGGQRLLESYEDEADWIQVDESDHNESEDESVSSARASLLRRGRFSNGSFKRSVEVTTQDESFYFTRSGAIRLDGVADKIRDCGLESTPEESVPVTDRVVVLEKLGQGAAGRVHKALDLKNLRYVAMKAIPVVQRDKRRQMVHELKALHGALRDDQSSDRQHVVQFYDAFANMSTATVSLMVEYMDGGSLQQICDNGGLSDERVLASLYKQAAKGLRYLHSTKHVHRDLKPANMLINRKGVLKLSDFGVVRKLEERDHVTEESTPEMLDPGVARVSLDAKTSRLCPARSFVGTVTYMSPERIGGLEYSTPADVWSLGLSFLNVALGKLPLENDDGYWSLLKSIRDEPPPTLPDHYSEKFRACVASCLAKDPAERPTADDVVKDPFCGIDDDESVCSTTDSVKRRLHRRSVGELVATLQASACHLRQLSERGASCGAPSDASAADAAAWLVNEVALDTLADQLDLPLDKVDTAVAAFVSASKNNEDAAAATKAAMDCGDDSDDELT